MGWGAGAVIAVAASIAAPATVCAQPAPVRLTVERERGAARCPDAQALRAGVVRRLGADPFRDDAGRALAVRIGGTPPRLLATIELVQGTRRSHRTLRSSARDCVELAAAVELAMSLAIDPTWEPWEEPEVEILVDPEPPSPSPPRLLPARLDGAITVDDEPRPRRRGGRGPWHIGVGSFLAFGSAPDLVIGVRLELGLRLAPWSFTVEPWLTLPSRTSAPGGHLNLSTGALSAVGCRAVGPLALCAHLAGGVMQAVGEGDGFIVRARARSPFGAAGGRLLYSAAVYPGISVRATADLLVPILRTELHADSSQGKIQAWSSPWVIPSVGLAFVGHFP